MNGKTLTLITLPVCLVAVLLLLLSGSPRQSPAMAADDEKPAVGADQKKTDGPPRRGRMLKRLPDILDLDADQRTRFDELLRKHQQEMDRLHAQIKAQIKQFGESVNGILTTDEQREKFEKIRRRMSEPRKFRDQGRGGMVLLRPRVLEAALDRVDVSDAQCDQVMDLVRDAFQQMRRTRGRRPAENREAVEKLTDQVREILGQEKFEQLREAAGDVIAEHRRDRGPGYGRGWNRGPDRGGPHGQPGWDRRPRHGGRHGGPGWGPRRPVEPEGSDDLEW